MFLGTYAWPEKTLGGFKMECREEGRYDTTAYVSMGENTPFVRESDCKCITENQQVIGIEMRHTGK